MLNIAGIHGHAWHGSFCHPKYGCFCSLKQRPEWTYIHQWRVFVMETGSLLHSGAKWLDSLQVLCGDDESVVTAHAEPPWARPIPCAMVWVLVDGVCSMQYVLLKVGSATSPWNTIVSAVEGEGTCFLEPLNNFGKQSRRWIMLLIRTTSNSPITCSLAVH